MLQSSHMTRIYGHCPWSLFLLSLTPQVQRLLYQHPHGTVKRARRKCKSERNECRKMWAKNSLQWSVCILIACGSSCKLSSLETEVARRHVRRVPATETEVGGTSDCRSVEYIILDGKMVWRVHMGYHYYCAMSFLKCFLFSVFVSVCCVFVLRFIKLTCFTWHQDKNEKRHEKCRMERSRTIKLEFVRLGDWSQTS